MQQNHLQDITTKYFTAFKEGVAPRLQPEFNSRNSNAVGRDQAHRVKCCDKNFSINQPHLVNAHNQDNVNVRYGDA